MKQRILKRIVATLLAATMVFAVVGCGSTEKKSEESKQSQASSQSKQSSEVKPSSEEVKKEEPVTVKWLMWGNEAQDHDKVMEELNKILVEKINVKLDMEVIADGEYKTRCQLACSSNEDFDILWVANWKNPFNEYLANESLMPLDDLLAEYGQGIKSALSDELLLSGTSDGKTYAIPNLQIMTTYDAFYVQKDLAEKYNLDINHVDDFYDIEPFLETIKANEPDLIPIHVGSPYSRYGYEIINSGIAIKKGISEIELVTDYANMYQEAVLCNTWWKKGYIRQDAYTATDIAEYRKAHRYAVDMTTYKPGVEANLKAQYGIDYVMIPVGDPYMAYNCGAATMTAINANSKNPEAAMKLIDFLYTDAEAFNMLLFGLEGTHYTWVDDAHIKQVENTTYNYSGWGWAVGNQFNAYPIEGQDADVWEKTKELNDAAEVSLLMGFTFDPTPIQTEIAQVSAVTTEYKNWYWNTDDVDKTFKEYYSKLQTAGLDTIAKEMQKQIDDWAAANK